MKYYLVIFSLLISLLGIQAQNRMPMKASVALVKVEGNDSIKDFFISTWEVSQMEWKSVMKKNPSMSTIDSYPVECVSWYAAVRFCNKLSLQDGYDECYKIEKGCVSLIEGARGYRLPFVREWEYAARGGKKSKGYRYAGSDKVDEVAWFDKNSNNIIHSVGTKAPNELGIYDMSGNVWEWCQDELKLETPADSAKILTAPDPAHFCCGGSWGDPYSTCEIGSRTAMSQAVRDPSVGFRVVLIR